MSKNKDMNEIPSSLSLPSNEVPKASPSALQITYWVLLGILGVIILALVIWIIVGVVRKGTNGYNVGNLSEECIRKLKSLK